MGIEMINVLRLLRFGNRSAFGFDAFGALQRLDAAYRERRRVEELTPELLDDIGLTREEVERALRR